MTLVVERNIETSVENALVMKGATLTGFPTRFAGRRYCICSVF